MNDINCFRCVNLITNKYCKAYNKKLYSKCTYTGTNSISPCELCKEEKFKHYEERKAGEM